MKTNQQDAPRDGAILDFKWTVSRGRDTYGYNIVTLRVDGQKVSSCNGGGYDMKGTALGNWVARAFSAELLRLKPAQMPAQSHWQPERTRHCAGACLDAYTERYTDAIANDQPLADVEPLPKLSEDTWECPTCQGQTRQSRDGKTIDDGRYFYGLTYHDPTYDPGKAVIGKDCNDRTFSGKSKGKTVEQAEADGDTVGLERYQAFYSASSKHPTKRHNVPLIDGACGFSSVEKILKAIGYGLEYVKGGKNDAVYILRRVKKARAAKAA